MNALPVPNGPDPGMPERRERGPLTCRSAIARALLAVMFFALVYALPIAAVATGRAGWWVLLVPAGIFGLAGLLIWAMENA